MLKQTLLVASVLALSATASADLTFKAGFGYLDPTATKDINDNLTDAKVSSEGALLPSFDYRFGNSPISAELLLATPFEHMVSVADGNGRSDIATFKHLPPTLTVKYNTPEYRGFGANVGVGATVVVPYEEYTVRGVKLKADTTVAPAAQVGVTYSPQSRPWGLFADVRYVDLTTDLEVVGTGKIGELEINPVVYSVGVSHKF